MWREVTNRRQATLRSLQIALSMTPEQREFLRRAANAVGIHVSVFALRSARRTKENALMDQQPEASPSGAESLPTFARSQDEADYSAGGAFSVGVGRDMNLCFATAPCQRV
jgi:hypothetical protein